MPTLKLLIVDDDAVDRRAVRRALQQARVEADIVECATAQEALEAARSGTFDCIFLDYYLPGATGLETLDAIRRLGVRAPVVSLTGHGDETLAVEVMKAGAADYLSKTGLTSDRLARSLRYAMALHQSEEERRKLLEREQQARREAQRANRAKDEFLATLSHELRTPLNAILGWTSLLAGGQLDPAASRKALAIIERNTRAQAQLIEDLLDISRIVTGKLRLEVKAVSLNGIAVGAIDAVRHAAEAKGVRLETQLGADVTIVCDPTRVQQVIWNLLTNAIKFTPSEGRIVVTTATAGERAHVTVADSGSGISAEFLPYVFERFRQEDGAATREHAGLGLGLSIVRHVVELHGGQVTAYSDGEGKGASFVVELPIDAAVAADASGVTEAIIAPPGEQAAR
jgi:signal transduction histidine kinase